jgi:multicomponent Na+:H+ antiporter subunit C
MFSAAIIYILAMCILSIGLLILMVSDNYLMKIAGLSIFQTSVLFFYIAFGKVGNALVPIIPCNMRLDYLCNKGATLYSSPLPHVLMLTAIVVGFATMAVALALILQVRKKYDTISERELNKAFIK